ncbi:hypothetical protein ACOTJF_27115 [Achromobacter ruhlandii]|uniref:hypothetical protein n=1 Tax=Achromobacter ruhlandii TaxID=72557 RepID=UPI003B9EBDE9
MKKDSAGATSAPRVPFRLNRTTAALCAGLMVSGSFSTAIAATGVQTVSLPAQEDPYSLEEVDGLGATGSSAYVISSPDGADVEANRVSVDGRTVVTGGQGERGEYDRRQRDSGGGVQRFQCGHSSGRLRR